jgi:hypothetical protein
MKEAPLASIPVLRACARAVYQAGYEAGDDLVIKIDHGRLHHLSVSDFVTV